MVPDFPAGEEDETLTLDLTVRIQTTEQLLAIEHDLLHQAAEEADRVFRENIFTERQERKAWNTVKSEIAALTLFMTYLREAGVPLSFHLGEEPRLWQTITFGLVKGFLRWEQKLGYATKTRNDHLSVIKLYARLAKQAGMMEIGQLLDITSIPRVRGAEGARIDRLRDQTRIGHKKPQPTFLERREEYQLLLERPKTPQGWRDKVAILLMYDLSLRPGEAVALRLADLDLGEHRPDEGREWTPPMTTRALLERLHAIGLEIEEVLYSDTRQEHERIHLTSYDGRHEWTRNAVRGGSDPIAVTKAGGWKGHSAMVIRYYGELQIANEDIKLKR